MLGTVIRALGQYPTESELADILRGIDPDGTNPFIPFQDFLQIMVKKIREPDTEDEVIEIFKNFDKDGLGFISVIEFRHIMKR